MTRRLLCALSILAATACGGSDAATTGTTTTDGGGTKPGTTDAGTTADAGSANADDASTGGPSDIDAGAGTDAGGSSQSDAGSGSGTHVTGTLGPLGPVKPIVSSLIINNSGETLVYLSSAPLTCATMQASRWLGSQPAGSQVIEVVIKGKPVVGTAVSVPPGEVNYAAGGKSSSYETNAASGSITFTRADANGVAEASISAKYSDGSSISGTFHADFCANGQQF